MDVDQNDGKEVKVVEEESAPKKPETDSLNAGATSPPPTTSETSSLASSDNKNDKKEAEVKTEQEKYEESSVQVNASEIGTARANSTSPIPASSNSSNIKRSMSDRNVLNGQGIDAHPYARGSVIEVVYNLPSNKDENDDDDLEEAYLAEEDDDFEHVTIDAEENTEKHPKNTPILRNRPA